MEGKHYFRVGECVEEVNALKGVRAAGIPTKYKSFGDNITYKMGYHCTIAASPASGKSYFALTEILSLVEREGTKAFIFSPEMGTKAEITALLVHMKSGKSVYEIEGVEKIGDDELIACLKWLNNHFLILDSDVAMDVEDIYEQHEKAEEEYNTKISYILLDNLNDLKEPNYGTTRQDLNVELMYSAIRRYNKKRNCYTFILTHSSSQGAPLVQNGIKYYLPISAREVRSGEAIFRKAFLFITLWRPPYGLQDESGIPYEENEVHVIVLKGKPANTATKGFVGKLYFDWKRAKYTDVPSTYKAY